MSQFPGLRAFYVDHLVEGGAKIQVDPYCLTYTTHTDIYEGKHHGQPVILKRWRVHRRCERILGQALKKLKQGLDEWVSVSAHPHILPFLGLIEAEYSLIPMLVMPRAKWNIMGYLAENPHADKLMLMHQLSSALTYLHSQRPAIVHGNIKDSNILVSQDERVLLSDIGVHEAFLIPEISSAWHTDESPRWMSPELLMSEPLDENSYNRAACDVWSFGMIVLQVFTGSLPYHNHRLIGPVVLDIAHRVTPPRPEEDVLDEGIWHMLVNCWSFNPRNRPRMAAVSHWVRYLREQQRISV